jgi:uncharacterized protein involved in exopolysaccharide biosynthesis
MRVYGSSPLFNYVELIFRSKRLFIASVVLGAVASVAIASARTGSYNAQALVYLTGADQTDQSVTDSAQKGSIRFKLNLLGVSSKDDEFMKAAFKDAGLDHNMTDEQFNDFCKKARAALSFGDGNNVLEINCHWPDQRAADIINAFFSAFSRRVADEESASSQIARGSIVKRLAEYTTKQKNLEQKVIDFKEAHLGDMPQSFEAEVQYIAEQKRQVATIENALSQAKMQRAEIERQLQNTPQQVEVFSDTLKSNALLDNLNDQKAVLQGQIADLLTKYTPVDPRVKAAQQKLDAIDAAIKAAEQQSGKKASQKSPSRTREELNPQYQKLVDADSQMDINVQALQGSLQDAHAALATMQQKAKHDPDILNQYEWMTKDYKLYTDIRDNLRARLEQAQITESQDREMHLAEMKMMVHPVSELEEVNARNMIFYAAGPLLGLIIAFAFSLLAESLDHSLRTPIEVEKYLGKPVLAVLPRMEPPKGSSRRTLGGGGDGPTPTLPS